MVETRQFGNTGMNITAVGFGAWAIGGGNWEFGWGAQDDQESIDTIKKAIDMGINWIDTAAVYGLGHSEEIVGKAIKGMNQRPYIFSKCSMRWDNERKIYRSLKAASLREEIENSLRRLDIDALDLYQIHWPDPEDEIEEGWSTLVELKKEGKVRHIGVSNFSVEQLQRAEKIAPVETQQPPYSIVEPTYETEILPYCKQQNIGVIVYSPMFSGLLTGKMTAERVAQMPQDDWRRTNPEFQGERLTRNLQLTELLSEIGRGYNVTPGVVAVAWTLYNPAVSAAIVGARRPSQVEETSAALSFRLSQGEYERIQQFVAQHP
ncbi:oxidoreductase [Ktedonobacteria bacterium brp13]|nr:oxidoreductase [Ktedonobacteria bacterium brp13]